MLREIDLQEAWFMVYFYYPRQAYIWRKLPAVPGRRYAFKYGSKHYLRCASYQDLSDFDIGLLMGYFYPYLSAVYDNFCHFYIPGIVVFDGICPGMRKYIADKQTEFDKNIRGKKFKVLGQV